MVDIATQFLMRSPTAPAGRTLYPGTLTARQKDVYTAELDSGEEQLPLEPEQLVHVLYYARQKFMQHAAQIDSVEECTVEGEITTTVRFRTLGDPVSAESRECYRISTAMAGLTATVEGEDQCQILDACFTGLSFVSTQAYQVGEFVTVRFTLDGVEYRGRCSVQSVTKMRRGRIRYGLYCIEDRRTAGNLPRGLQKLSMAVQREHLSRLARLR